MKLFKITSSGASLWLRHDMIIWEQKPSKQTKKKKLLPLKLKSVRVLL